MSTFKKIVIAYVVCCVVIAIGVTAAVHTLVNSKFAQKLGKAVNAELDRKIEGK